jgi:hypothetical protein
MTKNEDIIHQDPKEIAKYIINHTPVGLLDSALINLKVLVKKDVIDSPEIQQELNKYKQDHLIPIKIPNLQKKVIISPYNKDSDEFYYDQIQKIRFKLNNKYEPENIEEYDVNTEIFRKIWRRVDEYIKKYYKENNIHYNVYHNTFMDKIQILISGKISDNKNSWVGEWISIWRFDLEQKNMEGEIRINTVYNEDGNVQFNLKKNYEGKIKSKDESDIADEIINFIEKKEKYFEYRLYVQHATIIENEFVKEIKRIGRPIDKIIIVDNFSQNYKTNKKNAINIKSYFEKNCNDNTLIELEKILPKIINNGNDVRNGIEKYRNEIIGKVSSNIDI